MPDPTPQPPTPGPRILIVRPSALGDVCRTVPCLVSLRRALPGAHLDWLVNAPFAPAVASHPMLDGVVPFHRKDFSLGRGLALARRLRAGRYDTVYDLQGLLRSGVLTWLTRAPQRVGFANAREGAALCYNRKHAIDPALHTVERMLGLLEAAGIEPVRDLRLYVGEDDAACLDRFIDEHGLREEYTCLAPTAQWRCKCWPIERYAELAHWIEGPVVVLAAPHEHAQVQPLLEALGERAVFPRTTVGQLIALISRCRLLVCNDSAALHIAVAFGKPIVSVFGPTDPARVGPYQRPEAVVQPADITPDDMARYRKHKDDQSLIARVTVEQVRDAMAAQLDQRGD
ncbi:MAG: hypothetical protein GVY24_03970 [Planctomycetes bacterium]|jgi:lipopolysaccharide heptosyltransferase I|nr:hypothetical protein [Planctomycetota bacterium]